MKKPVVIGLAVVVLAAVVAGGYWWYDLILQGLSQRSL